MSTDDIGADQRERLARFGMTDEEVGLWEALAEVAGGFLALPVVHPTERQEVVQDLHHLQSRLLARPGLRAIGWARPEG